MGKRRLKQIILLSTYLLLTFVCHNIQAQERQSDDLFVIYVNNKAGFINKTGKVVVEPQFDRAGDFTEGLAPVSFLNYKSKKGYTTGFIDNTGKFVIKPQFESATSFSNGLSVIGFNVKYICDGFPEGDFGVIDKTGKLVVEAKFNRILPFKDDLTLAITKDRKQAFIDKSGRIITPLPFDYVDGFAENPVLVLIGDKYGYINKTGKFIVEPQFSQAQGFSDGLAIVKSSGQFVLPYGSYSIKKGDKTAREWKAVDKTGRVVFSIDDDFVNPFSEGLAAFYSESKFGYIDKTGKVAIKAQFESGSSNNFSEGLCKVFMQTANGSRLAYIDKTGKVVIQPNFDNGSDFHNDLASVYRGDYPNVTSAYIDKTGKIIWQFPK